MGLVAFLALAGFALDRAFQVTAQSGMRERLHSYALAYANSDFARDGSVIPPWDPPDPRFKRPGSGLYAQIVLPQGEWESDSAQGPQLPVGPMLKAREQVFEGPLPLTQINGDPGEVYRYGYGLIFSGSRVGYVLGDPGLISSLREAQPLWSVSSLGLIAARACCDQRAIDEAEALAARAAADRAYLLGRLAELPGVSTPDSPRAPFVVVHVAGAGALRDRLRADHGIALRRGDTFPGLDADWLRIAVRDRPATDALVAAWQAAAEPHGQATT